MTVASGIVEWLYFWNCFMIAAWSSESESTKHLSSWMNRLLLNIREVELAISSYVTETGHKPYWIRINPLELEELKRQAEEILGTKDVGGLPNYFLGLKVILDLNVKGWAIGP